MMAIGAGVAQALELLKPNLHGFPFTESWGEVVPVLLQDRTEVAKIGIIEDAFLDHTAPLPPRLRLLSFRPPCQTLW